MGIYGKDGWLDIDGLARNPFMLLIGSRRIGKTYGVLRKMLVENRKFIYMRRTGAEIEFSASDRTSPFAPYAPSYIIGAEKDTTYTYRFGDIDPDAEKRTIENDRGIMLSLYSVAKIRGFDGSPYTDIVYDEFIPERHVNKMRGEGEALLNAYETINGNRELFGSPPVTLWLLANSNNLDSPVLEALGIRQKIESMIARGQEYSILPDRGITIVCASHSPISDKKSKTALYSAVPEGRFTEMSLHNRFSFNDFSAIGSRNLKQFTPRAAIGDYAVFDSKGSSEIYCAKVRVSIPDRYDNTTAGKTAFRIANSDLYFAYLYGSLVFDNYTTKTFFAEIFPWLVDK